MAVLDRSAGAHRRGDRLWHGVCETPVMSFDLRHLDHLTAELAQFRTPAAQSPALDTGAFTAVVCLPTFRRPDQLRLTLDSLARQITNVRFAVAVVENEAKRREGAQTVRGFLETGALQGFCFVEPRQGNCHAINRAFGEARAQFPNAECFLMIDDDEIASPFWVDTMVAQALGQDADVVGAPVTPRFPPEAPVSAMRHPVFWQYAQNTGYVPMIYGSGNCLIRRRMFERLDDPDFDIAYNFLGGGDTDFFTRCREADGRFFWTREAEIFETVPADRLLKSWIIKRGLRIGAINYRIDRKRANSFTAKLKLVAKNCALAPVSCMRAARLAWRAEPAMVVAHPMLIAAGRLFAAFGLHPEQYRAEPTES